MVFPALTFLRHSWDIFDEFFREIISLVDDVDVKKLNFHIKSAFEESLPC